MLNATIKLEQHLPYRVAQLSNLIKQTTSDRFVQNTKLSSRDWRVMAIIGLEGPINSSHIVHRTGMDKATVSRAIRSLEEKSLIQRTTCPDDGRSHLLQLTPSGEATFSKLMPLMNDSDKEYKNALTPGETALLFELLDKLREHAESLLDKA